MKAIVFKKYGSPEVLYLDEVAKPVPGDKEVLIRIHATTVTAGDCEMRSLKLPFLFRVPLKIYMNRKYPNGKILGQELAGEIESIGRSVTKFTPGDKVFAATLLHMGAYAEYACLPESYPILSIPANMSMEEAATIPTGGLNALHFIRKARVKKGESVLINGAGGSIGTYGLQIAKTLGAFVTCVDRGNKLEMLRSIGADEVIDYEKDDFTKHKANYDVIIDVVGKSSFSRCIKALKPGGRYVLGNPGLSGVLRGIFVSVFTNKKVLFELAGYKIEDMVYLKKLIEEGKIKSVIDKRYTLEALVEAHQYVEKGLKSGNLVIEIMKSSFN